MFRRNAWICHESETTPGKYQYKSSSPGMPMAMRAGLDDKMTDTGNWDERLPEWEKNLKDVKIPTFFNKMPQETGKTFPHSKQVGNYLVGKMINKGSFAKVMEGLHIPTGEKVAIKVIDKRKAKQDDYVLKNMKREPWIHQMIKHPNIVQLYETLETDNSYYMVMELCLGGDLLDRICDKKRLVEQEVKRYTRQILSAVEHLHCQGIVHRDLKIENFLLDENNNIKIIDFGLSNTARFEGLSQELLHTQCGSPAYAAPELLAHKKYGPKVDVWSIGVSMFAMLTGTLPFTVEPFNIKQLHQKMLIGEISPIPSDISPGKALQAVHFMQTLLEPDPAKRPGVKEAIKDKWLNEGFSRKILNSAAYENRFCPSVLNPVVLNYMTDIMEFSLSEVINSLINNRPSPAMSSYCLLLKKLLRYQKDCKRAQVFPHLGGDALGRAGGGRRPARAAPLLPRHRPLKEGAAIPPLATGKGKPSAASPQLPAGPNQPHASNRVSRNFSRRSPRSKASATTTPGCEKEAAGGRKTEPLQLGARRGTALPGRSAPSPQGAAEGRRNGRPAAAPGTAPITAAGTQGTGCRSVLERSEPPQRRQQNGLGNHLEF
ncbi:hormonally up-regulated neu tumor-associated kinase-like [Sylvia atricapilla]|uniref:hormonally up-regulated neu tumor-associated kinase-like n=1 Tax=Sylvia atricapilla TaxID=48155 RepID=UPI0033959C74